MSSAQEAVAAAAATYAPGAEPTISHYAGAVRIFVTRPSGRLLASFEGTHDSFGWGIDFNAWPTSVNEKVSHATLPLPMMHRGFYDATFAVLDEFAAAVGDEDYEIDGHSLGGAVGLGVGAAMAARGRPPKAITLFAPARVFLEAPDVLAGVLIIGYRCGSDPVPDVPPLYWRPILKRFPQPANAEVPQGWGGKLDPCHHIDNFVKFLAQDAPVAQT